MSNILRDKFISEQQKLAHECLQTALDKGFDPPTWENLPIKVMLVVTEVEEAINFVQEGGNDPLGEELADIWIRVSGILSQLWGEHGWSARYHRVMDANHLYHPIEVHMWPIVKWCCRAVEAWRHDKKNDVQACLELALKETWQIAATLGIDIEVEIYAKLEKNRQRAHLHGKAKSSG